MKHAMHIAVGALTVLLGGTAHAVPTYLNGTYELECDGGSASFDIAIAAILGSATGDSSTGSTFIVYCGPDLDPASVDCDAENITQTEASFCAYQHQLDTASADLERLCLSNPFNTAPDPDAFCADAAADWRVGLQALNDDIAGIAANRVELKVYGNIWNDIWKVWSSYSTTTLDNGAAVATNYTVTPGHLFSAQLGPAGSNVGADGGCAGTLAAYSEGWFTGTDMRIDNHVGGLLTCAVGQGGDGIAIAIAVGAKMTSSGTKTAALSQAALELDDLCGDGSCGEDVASEDELAGCSAAGGMSGGAWLFGLAALVLVRRRRRRRRRPSSAI